jgi:hypothetical protein
MLERGATLVETAVATGIVVVAVGISVPLVTAGRHEQRVIDAARFMSGRFMLARASAVRRGAAVGIRFEAAADGVRLRTYVDTNGNGVRTADITAGIDLPIDEETTIGAHFSGVRFALGAATPAIGAGTPAGTGADAIRFGASDILVVTPLGTATSGTLYLRSREGHQAAVRILGATARARIHQYDFQARRWRAR